MGDRGGVAVVTAGYWRLALAGRTMPSSATLEAAARFKQMIEPSRTTMWTAA